MSCDFRQLRLRCAAALAGALGCATAAAQGIPAQTQVQTRAQAQDLGPGQTPAQQSGERGYDFSLALSGGASWSDNLERAPDGQDGTIGTAGIALGYEQQSRRLQTNIDLNAAYQTYSDDLYDDDVIGGVDATLNLGIVPETFLWFVQENFGQLTADPFAAATPDNREDINYFTTGPDLILNFGTRSSLQLSGRYSDTQYETTESDGQQYGGVLSFARRISGTATVSANLEGTSFEFDDTTQNTDYDRYLAYLSYQLAGSRTSLVVDAGYTKLEFDDVSNDGFLGRFSLSRRLSPSSTVALSFGQQFSDSGDLFRSGQDTWGVSQDSAEIIGTSDPFISRYVALGYDFARNRTTFGFNVSFNEEDYETQSTFDRDYTTYGVYVTRQLSRVIDIRFFGQLEDEAFDGNGYDEQEIWAGAALNWTLGRTLSLRIQYDFFDRDSSEADTEYTENRGSLFLVWSPLAR